MTAGATNLAYYLNVQSTGFTFTSSTCFIHFSILWLLGPQKSGMTGSIK